MTRKTTQFQKEVARRLGIKITDSSFSFAAAQIEQAIAAALWNEPDLADAIPKQIEYATSLGIDVSKDSKRVASAKIQEQQDILTKI